MIDQVDIWKMYIEAQEILLAAYSAPFSIIPSSLDHVKDKIYKVEVNTASLKDNAESLIKIAFPNIPDEDIDWENGLIKKHSAININPQGLRSLVEDGPAFFLYANPLPSITFKLQSNLTESETFNRIIGRIPLVKNDVVFLKSNEIEKIKSDQSSCFELVEPFGAIFYIQPHSSYYKYCQDQFFKSFENSDIDISFYPNGNVEVNDFKLSSNQVNLIESKHPFRAKNIEISVKIANNELFFVKPIHYWRRSLGVYWRDEKNIVDPSVILPRPRDKVFTFFLDVSIDDDELQQNISYLRRIFNEIFEPENVCIQYKTNFIFQTDIWWSQVTNILTNKGFNVSPNYNTASFDFTDIEYANKMRQELLSVDLIQSNDNGDDHLFKIHYKFSHPLDKIKRALKSEIPHLSIHYSRDTSSLICSYAYHAGHENEHEKLIAIQHIEQVIRTSCYEYCTIVPPVIELGYEEYSFDFRYREGLKELEQQLMKLRNQEIGYRFEKRFEHIGTLKKIDFPYLIIDFTSDPDILRISPKIYGDFKGEQDKIQRLRETIDRIYGNSSKSCVNSNTREIIKNSSSAIGNDDLERLQEYLDKVKEVEETRLNKLLNPKQIEAVVKSLFANDVFVIQGPPGTGKSTGISEIIWQHLRMNPKQRILVTSETNLAVDNALDKLRSPFHNLIKPIRFGDEYKLDKEGLRFSYNIIENWVYGRSAQFEDNADDEVLETNDDIPCNIVSDWIERIGKYSGSIYTNEESAGFITLWKSVLNDPDHSIKKVFFDEYRKAINVVGATCSSIGKKSSTGSFTTFFKDYCEIYSNHSFSRFSYGILTGDKSLIASGAQSMNDLEISFDLVIQDEASKATPPEMALPMVYAKKSIVIGDHRQLPPMIDSNEFIQDIIAVAAKSKNNALYSKARDLAKQIKTNIDCFTVSHFERLYKNIHNSLKTAFDIQYRMHPSINEVISQFYPIDPSRCEYGLSCGLDKKFVDEGDYDNPESRHHGIAIPGFIQPHHHIVWIDTTSPEVKLGTSRYNQGEVQVVEKLLTKLSESDTYKVFEQHWKRAEEKQIGLITFYGAQLFRLFPLRTKFPTLPLRISTVDRFQGMERNIIIVSTVRSDLLAISEDQLPEQCESQLSMGFAEFPNRLNVALSRAKRLLIIVGNANHFSKERIYLNVLETIKQSPHGLYLNANDFIHL